MNATDKKQCIAKGLCLDAADFFGSKNDSIRAEMKRVGAAFDSGSRKWVFPSREAMEPFMPKTLPDVSAVTPPVAAVKPVVAPEPAVAPKPATAAPVTAEPAPVAPVTAPVTAEPASAPAKPVLQSLPTAGLPRPAPAFPKPKLVSLPKADVPLPTVQTSSGNSEKTDATKPLQTNGKSVQVGTWSRSSLMRLPAAFLVMQSVQIKGAVEYLTEDETREYEEQDGTITSTIKKTTQRVIVDEEEHKKTKKMTNNMRNRIRDLGVSIQPGVIRIRKARQEELDTAMSEIRAEALAHNERARYHFIRLLISYEETSAESVAYAQQFAYLVQEGMDKLRQAIDTCDVKKIRSEAVEFKRLAEATTGDDSALILEAVKEARDIAKFVDKEVTRKSKQIESVKRRLDTEVIDSIRMRFLQYEAPPEMAAARQSIDSGRFAGLDADAKPMVVNGGIEPGRFGNGK